MMCLEDVSENMTTNLKFDPEPPISTSGRATWTHEFKEAVVEAVGKWGREPEALQVMKWVKKLDAEPGKFLESFSDKELAMWRTHVKNNHVPYHRRCRTCVTSAGTGKIWQGDCRLLWWLRTLPTSSYAMCCSFGDQSR